MINCNDLLQKTDLVFYLLESFVKILLDHSITRLLFFRRFFWDSKHPVSHDNTTDIDYNNYVIVKHSISIKSFFLKYIYIIYLIMYVCNFCICLCLFVVYKRRKWVHCLYIFILLFTVTRATCMV